MSVLRGRNLASREAKRQESLFMTEPQEEIPLGGGFIPKWNRETERQADVGVDELKLSFFRPTTPQNGNPTPRTGKRSKRILRPQTTVAKRRPQTSFGPMIGE
jgi:hypothetical protein